MTNTTQQTNDAAFIAVDEFVERLDEPGMLVVDIRTEEAWRDWQVPGSLSVPASRLAAEGADALPHRDRETVVVCARGVSAQPAAALLREQGIQAVTLTGGMQAWSCAWSAHRIPLATTRADVTQVARLGKGCLSYLVCSGTSAAVIDPSLPSQVYVDLAREADCAIDLVLDTHVHADHLSRARDLARRTGAQLVQPSGGRLQYEVREPVDGERLTVGASTLAVLATPGHTGESVSLVLDELAAIFTGDTLFVDSVGRPDLEAGAANTDGHARLLHRSLGRLLALAGDDTVVLPAHHSGTLRPADTVTTTIGELRSLDVLNLDERQFVSHVLERLPSTPPNHEQIGARNRAGATIGDDALKLEAGANRCAIAH